MSLNKKKMPLYSIKNREAFYKDFSLVFYKIDSPSNRNSI